MPAWEHSSDLAATGANLFVVLEELGPDGWEAWHVEKLDEGWREVHFKRAADPRTTRSAELAADLLSKMQQRIAD